MVDGVMRDGIYDMGSMLSSDRRSKSGPEVLWINRVTSMTLGERDVNCVMRVWKSCGNHVRTV